MKSAGAAARVEESGARKALVETTTVRTTALARGRSDLYQGLVLLAEGYIESAPAAERFRILRAKIERLNLGPVQKIKVISVTSALPSEGKSVCAVNLARALSIDPLGKTLLIDCDLRKPTVNRFFRIPRDNGLSDALFARKLSNQQIRSVAPGLDVMTAGTQVVDPAEAIEQPDLEHFIKELRNYYRYIIIDCPPALLCPEPIRISTIADTTILVARAWRTDRSLVRDAVDAIGQHRLLGVVLNDGMDTSRQYLQYGSYYGTHV
jgi:capsular exopolysaccharide synthesis family protein